MGEARVGRARPLRWNRHGRPVTEFLVSQLDYIHFFYGLVLVLLGAVSVAMSASAPVPKPWWLLGLFATLHESRTCTKSRTCTMVEEVGFSSPARVLRVARTRGKRHFAQLPTLLAVVPSGKAGSSM